MQIKKRVEKLDQKNIRWLWVLNNGVLVGNSELPDGELIGNGELLKKSEIAKRVEKVTLSAVHSQSQCSYVRIVRMRLGEIIMILHSADNYADGKDG